MFFFFYRFYFTFYCPGLLGVTVTDLAQEHFLCTLITVLLELYYFNFWFFLEFFAIHSPGGCCNLWNFVCTLCNWFAAPHLKNCFLCILDVFDFFIAIFDIHSPGGHCNWPSTMKFLRKQKWKETAMYGVWGRAPKRVDLVVCPLKTETGVYLNDLHHFNLAPNSTILFAIFT